MVTIFLAPQYSRILLLVYESKPLLKISLITNFSYTSPQSRVFATNSLAYCNEFIPSGCANRSIADFVFAIMSSVV